MAKKDSKEALLDDLTEKQKTFCREYIYDWNGSRAYKAAYPDIEDSTARTNASKLLTNANIQAYIEDIQKDLEKLAGISRLRVFREHEKIAFSSIAHLHNTWVTRKAFEELTDDQKASIEEISTQIKTSRNADGTLEENEYIKIKLYSKQKSLDSINKMFGYEEAQKITLTDESVKSFKIVSASTGKGSPRQ